MDSIKLKYTNYKGITSIRNVVPKMVYWGMTEHHPGKQFILEVFDMDKKSKRDYALADCDFTQGE